MALTTPKTPKTKTLSAAGILLLAAVFLPAAPGAAQNLYFATLGDWQTASTAERMDAARYMKIAICGDPRMTERHLLDCLNRAAARQPPGATVFEAAQRCLARLRSDLAETAAAPTPVTGSAPP